MKLKATIWIIASLACAIDTTNQCSAQSIDSNYQDRVLPFLNRHCVECHGPKRAESDFRIDLSVNEDFDDRQIRSQWTEVVNVLNSHTMPPEDRKQPEPREVSAVVDWIIGKMVLAEQKAREHRVVMRRLNRDEYKNTIRDLMGIVFDVSHFPQDPPAGGFDNIGSALSLSPMQIEIYLDSARQIVDKAFVRGDQPESIRWRFEIDQGSDDSYRVRVEGNNPIVNGGNNPTRDGLKIVHHANWDKLLNVRDFRLKHAGKYIVRVRAAGQVPTRSQVIESAKKYLKFRFDESMRENPSGERWHREFMDAATQHFELDSMYEYGPPRMKVTQDLGGQPRVIAEFDVEAPETSPKVYEIPIEFTTESAGITLEYAYSIPNVLENTTFQTRDDFPRPTLLVDWIEIEGPLFDAWPPTSHTRCSPEAITPTNEKELIEKTIGRFVRRAFRHPITREEVAPYVRIYYDARKEGLDPLDAFKSSIVAILVSPQFLFLAEQSPDLVAAGNEKAHETNSPVRVGPHELASRISYFLWSSMPDKSLLSHADNRTIFETAHLRAEVLRMLKDQRSEALIHNFSEQWLGLREVGANPPAMDLYPHYDRHLETSVVEEGRAMFRTVLREGRNLLDFVDADYVVINERLARFYEIAGVRGDDFRSVLVKSGQHRGGLITSAAMLTITSNGTRTSPVKRGVWIMKNMLGTDPGLPVANAGDIAPKVPGIDKATVRQRLEIHRELPQCARCHSKIDPLGLALENYNASGQYREREGFGYKGRVEPNDPKIDAASQLPDGTALNGPDQLKQVIRARKDEFMRCFTEKLLTYALGRELTIADRPDVTKIVEATQANDNRLDECIIAIVESSIFQSP